MMLRLLALIAATHVALAATARADSPETRLRAGIDEVLTIANGSTNGRELENRVRPVLPRYLGFAAMTRRAIGPGWRQFSPAQQQQATELFSALIVRNYCRKFTPGERPRITYRAATTPAPGRMEVPTTVSYEGNRYEVIYRLEQAEDWRVTDVVIEGVSFIANYRTQFDAQFKKGGAAAVLASLNQSVNAPR